MGVKKLEHLWLRSPRLGRGWRTVINLILAGLLLTVFWGLAGYPLPTEEMELRRLERQHLLGPTEIILHVPDRDVRLTGARDGIRYSTQVSQFQAQFVGLGDGYAVTAAVHPFSDGGGWLQYWPLEEQEEDIKLIPMFTIFGDWREQSLSRDGHTCCGIVIPELPEEAGRAELTLWENGEEYRDNGTWEKPGCWLFAFQNRGDSFGSDWLQGLPYELTVYGEDGGVILRQEGTVPESEWRTG